VHRGELDALTGLAALGLRAWDNIGTACATNPEVLGSASAAGYLRGASGACSLAVDVRAPRTRPKSEQPGDADTHGA